MRCEEWTERIAARFTGELADEERQALDRHVAACPRCRAELAGLDETWAALARVPDSDVPSERMRVRLTTSLPAVQATRRWLSRVGRLAAAALIAAAAFLAGRFWNPPAEAAPPDARPRYLLLLHERPESAAETPEQARAVVAEYKDWARRLRAEGKLVGGEKLADEGVLLSPAGVQQLAARPGVAGGYFVVRASTRDEALRIARDCPHVRRGGTVEVRPIENV